MVTFRIWRYPYLLLMCMVSSIHLTLLLTIQLAHSSSLSDMDCVKPIQAWRTGVVYCKMDGEKSPKLEFSPRRAEAYFRASFGPLWAQAMADAEMLVPCGKCPNCLARKRAFKAVQLCHENSCHDKACFVTLTYDEDHVPTTDYRPNDSPCKQIIFGCADESCLRTLYPRDLQLFMKRLRRHLTYVPKRNPKGRDHVDKIRFFAVGEYGSRTQRPHYHLIIFGWWPSDSQVFKADNHISAQIAKLWPHGHHLVSPVTQGRCKYCAQYVTKKLIKSQSNLDNRRHPEFIRQSCKGGGMGVPWFLKYAKHCAAVGYVTYRADKLILKSAIPPAYIRALRKYFVSDWRQWRKKCEDSVPSHCTLEELHARAKLNVEKFRKALYKVGPNML